MLLTDGVRGAIESARTPAWPAVRAGYAYLGLACALFAGLAAYFTHAIGSAVVDDTYIALVYARNLAAGDGLVWTDGQRVEGYTDFLWVLIGAGAFLADLDPVLVYRVAGIASGVGLLVAVWAWNNRFSTAPSHARIAPLLLAAMGPVAFWAIAGLEATAFAALAFTATLAAAAGGRGVAASGLLFFLAALAHPDAVVLLAPVAVYVLLRGRPARNWRALAALLFSFGVPFGVYWIARWAYFGDLLPNTFYAKDTFSLEQVRQGYVYVMQFAPLAWLFAAFLIVRAFMRGLRASPEAWLLGGQLGLWLAYMLYSGGDHMPMHRFLVPILPALALLLQEACWGLASRAGRRKTGLVFGGATVAAMALLWLGSWTAWTGGIALVEAHAEVRQERRELGLWLRANSGPDDVVAVSAAGAVPYFSERPAIDMLGLAGRHIAHNGHTDDAAPVGHKRYDATYVLDCRPEFIILTNIAERGQPLTDESGRLLNGEIEMAALPSNQALFQDERFWSEYTRVTLSGVPGVAASHIVVIRNDRVKALAAEGLLTVVQVVVERPD